MEIEGTTSVSLKVSYLRCFYGAYNDISLPKNEKCALYCMPLGTYNTATSYLPPQRSTCTAGKTHKKAISHDCCFEKPLLEVNIPDLYGDRLPPLPPSRLSHPKQEGRRGGGIESPSSSRYGGGSANKHETI